MLTVTGVVFFAAIGAFSESHRLGLSEVLAFIEGFNGILMISCFNVSLQHLSSDAMRGRIMSIYATSFLGLPPLGSLMAGELSRHMATAHVLALMSGVATVMFVAVFAGRGHCESWISSRYLKQLSVRLSAVSVRCATCRLAS